MKLLETSNEWDWARVDENKQTMRILFNDHIIEGDTYELVYGFSQDVESMDDKDLQRPPYELMSLIIGYREHDPRLVMLATTPYLDKPSDPIVFEKNEITKFKRMFDEYLLYVDKFMLFNPFRFTVKKSYSDDENGLFAYINQSEEYAKWERFWNDFAL